MNSYPQNKQKDWQNAREEQRSVAQSKHVSLCNAMLSEVPDREALSSAFCEECDYRVSTQFFGTLECKHCGNCIEHIERPDE